MWIGWIYMQVQTSGKLQTQLELRFGALEVTGKILIEFTDFEFNWNNFAQQKSIMTLNRNSRIQHVGYLLAGTLQVPVIHCAILKTDEMHDFS